MNRSLVELAARFEYWRPAMYRGYWFREPAVPSAHCLGCAGFHCRTNRAAVKPPSTSSFRVCLSFRVLPSRIQPAGRSRRTPLLDFRSLQHMQESAIHSSRAFQARYGPRAGFVYPLRGLRPPIPGRLCFTPAALMGFALRSLLPRRGRRCVSARPNPLAVSLVGKRSAWSGGPARRAAASGVCLAPRFLATGGCLVRRTPDAPVGFSLARCADRRLRPGFPGRPLLRFAAAGRFVPQPPALQSVCQRRPGPDRWS